MAALQSCDVPCSQVQNYPEVQRQSVYGSRHCIWLSWHLTAGRICQERKKERKKRKKERKQKIVKKERKNGIKTRLNQTKSGQMFISSSVTVPVIVGAVFMFKTDSCQSV